MLDAMMSYTKRINYVELFEEVEGYNSLKYVFFGRDMELVLLSHPKHGVFFDLFSSDSG
ncbi:hypothetical protein [Candidatus Enterovibrio escicola]|uniref:Uncharacterized protein n=2 Tax=Candidatus Enterovibrio escicola TaxID=1927127 RepID=A0A2A5T5I8_9GAMM|nr:hypothetical protein [Candidatus Enterovibrio escacola]PCS23406.1 hypothetical protein BTN49_1003 [Candidatus Enterovibrio escacola]